jgi:hypothetical protein
VQECGINLIYSCGMGCMCGRRCILARPVAARAAPWAAVGQASTGPGGGSAAGRSMDSPCGSYVALAASRWAVVASAPDSLLQPCRGAQGPVISHAMVRARQQHLRLLICPARRPTSRWAAVLPKWKNQGSASMTANMGLLRPWWSGLRVGRKWR